MKKGLFLMAALLFPIGVLAQGGDYADSTRTGCSQAGVTCVLALNPFLNEWVRYPSQTLDSMPALPAPDRIDRYGGWADGPRFKRTGYFRTARHEGRWVLVNPDGHLQLDASVVHVRPGSGEAQKAAFAARFADRKDWYEQTADQLLSYGFNGSAAVSNHTYNSWYNRRHKKRKFCHYVSLSLMSRFAWDKKVASVRPGHTGFPADCILVFDPGFEPYCDSVLSVECAKYRKDKNLIGYFSDNELPFSRKNLEGYLSLPESDYGHQAAVQWLEERGIAPDRISDRERCEFSGWVAERYFETVSRLLRKYDPDHLYLGSRLHDYVMFRQEILEAAGKYCDVVCFNYYDDWAVRDEDIRCWDAWSGKPFMITEFYTKGEDSGLPNTRGSGWRVPTQKDRGVHYQNFVLTLLRSDSCVGWHWFKYQDNDPTDTTANPADLDSNKGMLDNRYEVYPDLVEAMKAVNERRYGLMEHFWSESPLRRK